MKKLFAILILAVFFISFAPIVSSAAYDDKVQFHEPTGDKKYGHYEINDTTFWLFNNKPVKTIELLENEYSILTAYNIKEIEMFRNGKLFDKTNYLDKEQKKDRSNVINSEVHYYRVYETKTRTISDVSCSEYDTVINGTNSTEVCIDWLDNSYTEEYNDWSDWMLYDFKNVEVGLYQTKTVVSRTSQNTGVVDWVDENDGHDLTEWAVWWDNSWDYKVKLNVTENSGSSLTNYSTLIYVNYTKDTHSHANSNFSDLRFLNSTQDGELYYWIENKTDGQFAWVWVKVPTLTASSTEIIYMYYGNSEASSNSDIKTAFLLGDDFNDVSIDTSLWDVIGTPTESGGSLTCNGSGEAIFSKNFINQTHQSKTKMTITGGTNYLYMLGGTSGYNSGGKWNMVASPYNMIEGDYSSEMYLTIRVSSTYTQSPRPTYTKGVTYINELIYNGSTTIWKRDGIQEDSTTSEYNDNLKWMVGNSDQSGEGTITTDWTYSRGYASAEPTYVFGAEEESSGVSTTLIHPTNGQNIVNNTVNFNYTSTPNQVNLTNATAYIWWSNGTLLTTNATNLTGNTSVTTNFALELDDGMYKWNAETCPDVGNCSFASSNNSFTVHATPINITITSPTGLQDYLYEGKNLTLNWNLAEEGENLTEHLANCSYTYNGTINYLSIATCVDVETLNFSYVIGQDSLTFNTTDIFNLTSSQTTNWSYNVLENAIIFNNETIEGATESFQINFSVGNGLQASTVKLIYAGIEYPSQFLSTDNFVIANNDVPIPGINASTNNSFYWSIMLSDSNLINTTENNQSVLTLEIDDCSSFSTLLFNYTQRDEETQNILTNNSVEISVDIFDSNRDGLVVDFSKKYNDTNPMQICININLSEGVSYSIDSVVKYTSNESSGYALEYFNLLNFTMSNSTIPENTNLYSLLEQDSTEFQLTFRDVNLALASNILVFVNRQYVSDNDFKTVEKPITDSNGQAILHLVRNDIQYNFIMVDESGEIIATFNKKNVFCQDITIGSCTLNLNSLFTESEVYKNIEDQGILYSYSYSNTTKIISFEFVSIDLTSKEVGIEVTRDTDFGNRSVCVESLISASGIITCNVSEASENTNFLFMEIFVDSGQKAVEIINLDSNGNDYGVTGYFLAFLIILMIITMFMDDRKALVVSLMIGWLIVISLGLVGGSLFGSISAGIWLLITIMIYIWKLSKEETI
jgi:hypothetical protein